MDDDEFDARYRLFELAWETIEDTERQLRRDRWRIGRLKRWTVCWWKHRTRRAGPGTYVSGTCWACSR